MFVLLLLQILIVAVTVSFWYRKRADFHTFSRIEELQIQLCSRNSANLPEEQFRPEETYSYLQRVTARIDLLFNLFCSFLFKTLSLLFLVHSCSPLASELGTCVLCAHRLWLS